MIYKSKAGDLYVAVFDNRYRTVRNDLVAAQKHYHELREFPYYGTILNNRDRHLLATEYDIVWQYKPIKNYPTKKVTW